MNNELIMNDKLSHYLKDSAAKRAKGTPLVCWFEECSIDSVALVGGKCSSLGELINAGVRVPPGFALTTEGYRRFMAEEGLDREVKFLLSGLNTQDMDELEKVSLDIRRMIEGQPFIAELEDQIAEFYRRLSVRCCLPAVPVAVRSSATAEDLEGASFAGQQDTFLWIRGADEVLQHVVRCISSLYTARAIAYRANHSYHDDQMAISVGIQKMANSFTAGGDVHNSSYQWRPLRNSYRLKLRVRRSGCLG